MIDLTGETGKLFKQNAGINRSAGTSDCYDDFLFAVHAGINKTESIKLCH